MYKIIYINKKWNGRCVKYGFKPYLKRELFRMSEDYETYEIEWVIRIRNDFLNFKKCWKKYYDVLEKFPNIY